MKHTKGPWIVLPKEPGVPYLRIRGTVLGGRYKVANVHVMSWHWRDEAESEANACLISAAPELLDALILARDMLGGINVPYQITNAIAKAIGE